MSREGGAAGECCAHAHEDSSGQGPLASIVMPCHNAERWLARTLFSVLSQTYRPLELVLVDDGSTDGSLGLVRAWVPMLEASGVAVQVLTKPNGGQASAVNLGLKAFTGDVLTWADADDVLLPRSVELRVQALLAHPDCGMCMAQGVLVGEGDLADVVAWVRRIPTAGEDGLFEDVLRERNVTHGPGTVAAWRWALDRCLSGLDIYEGREGQNWQLMLPLAYGVRCCYVDAPTYAYVRHADSHSQVARDVEEGMARYRGFQEIVGQTLRRIPDMGEDERAWWCAVSRALREEQSVRLAWRRGRPDLARAELRLCDREGVRLPLACRSRLGCLALAARDHLRWRAHEARDARELSLGMGDVAFLRALQAEFAVPAP